MDPFIDKTRNLEKKIQITCFYQFSNQKIKSASSNQFT